MRYAITGDVSWPPLQGGRTVWRWAKAALYSPTVADPVALSDPGVFRGAAEPVQTSLVVGVQAISTGPGFLRHDCAEQDRRRRPTDACSGTFAKRSYTTALDRKSMRAVTADVVASTNVRSK
jgi:hypothetical protein